MAAAKATSTPGEQRPDARALERGDRREMREVEELELALQVVLHVLALLGVHRVPFVDRHHQRAPRFEDVAADVGVLLGDVRLRRPPPARPRWPARWPAASSPPRISPPIRTPCPCALFPRCRSACSAFRRDRARPRSHRAWCRAGRRRSCAPRPAGGSRAWTCRRWGARRSPRAGGRHSSSSPLSSGKGASASSTSWRTPSPCSAEMARGSPRASSWNSAVTTSSRMPSVLLTASSTGACASRSCCAMRLSWGVSPARPSTRKTMTSASAIASRAWRAISERMPSLATGSKPPVSTAMKGLSPRRPGP